ncbi:GTP cyclohydrolase I FolE [Pediococcus acidilactici]|nr:GTP cyclohydrolase I FolE [Pediococcus acidilactici]
MIQEVKILNLPKIEKAVSDLLEGIGEDPQREGLVETPKRVAKAYAELFAGLNHQATDFTDYKIFHVDEEPEMVLVQKIPFYSVCEHHLLPFFGNVDVAYVPKDGKVIGISKIPRLVDFVVKRPGMQEKVTTQISSELTKILDPQGVAVTVSARHLCMEMRGINQSNLFTYTSKMTGVFKNDQALRANFFQQVGQQNA